jgi:hypothetical protein
VVYQRTTDGQNTYKKKRWKQLELDKGPSPKQWFRVKLGDFFSFHSQ